ncbi:hypothetical protein GGI11_002602 [Coemansia sp. RSA 2049]|nr:hypothetical protein H4217_004562 [Coemansia sp. RSA 1939]KAJ2519341.1 hypothetical protein GGI11_002602 [Coemansia sp. RSA 2049]KAJ2609561.1 hypothetical protein EV177_004406 [Coemansia sp. RSA 1804]KAJ2693528.1 hypothetical protein GGH99_001116 [Coemansia sp. RSA 1285]
MESTNVAVDPPAVQEKKENVATTATATANSYQEPTDELTVLAGLVMQQHRNLNQRYTDILQAISRIEKALELQADDLEMNTETLAEISTKLAALDSKMQSKTDGISNSIKLLCNANLFTLAGDEKSLPVDVSDWPSFDLSKNKTDAKDINLFVSRVKALMTGLDVNPDVYGSRIIAARMGVAARNTFCQKCGNAQPKCWKDVVSVVQSLKIKAI